MLKEQERDRQAIRFMEWIQEHPGWWKLICTPKEEHMNLQIMQQIIDELVKESFYEAILVLLMVHRDEKFMDCLKQTILMQLLIAEWRAGRKAYILKEVMDYFE